MTEGENRPTPAIKDKDKLSDPLAIRVANILAFLKLPLKEISPTLSAENRIIRNAGILLMPLYTKIFETQETIKEQIEKQTRCQDRIIKITKGLVIARKHNGKIPEKLVEHYDNNDDNIPNSESELGREFKRLRKEKNDLFLYDRIRKGSATKEEVKKFIEKLHDAIQYGLGIRHEVFQQIDPEETLSVEGLICLAVLNPSSKLEVREKAEQYIRDNDRVAGIFFDHFSQYFFHSHGNFAGYQAHVLRAEYGAVRLKPRSRKK